LKSLKDKRINIKYLSLSEMGDFFVVPHFQKIILFPSAEVGFEVISQFNLSVCMYRARYNMTQID